MDHRRRINGRSGSVLGRRFPGEQIFFFFLSIKLPRFLRDTEGVHVRCIPMGIRDSNMAAGTSRDRWVRGSHVGRCARLEITSSRSWNARGLANGSEFHVLSKNRLKNFICQATFFAASLSRR